MRKLIIIAVAVIVVAGIGAYLLLRSRGSEQQFHFRTAEVEKGWVQDTVTATGSLSAVATVQVGTQVSGTIKELYVDYNSPVSKGQELALIDPASFQAELDQSHASWRAAEASVVSAEADLAVADSAVTQAKADLELNRANEKKVEVSADYAQRTLKRYEDLVESGAVSPQDIDTQRNAAAQAAADLAAAQARVVTSEAALASARSHLGTAKAQIDVAKARRDQAKAALDFSQVNLERTLIRSPINGVVVNRAIDVGQTVAASFSTPTLFEIAQDLSQMQIEADVDEADIGGIHPEGRALFTVEAYPDQEFHGSITQVRLSPKVAQNVVTYTVIVSAQNPDAKLLPGMTASVTFLVGERHDVLRVPNAALRFEPTRDMIAAAYRFGDSKDSSNSSETGAPRDFGSTASSAEPVRKPPKGTVWVVDPATKLLHPIEVLLGLNDARFTELTGNELKQGDNVVSAVTTGEEQQINLPFAGPRGGPRR